jgi:predicted permease
MLQDIRYGFRTLLRTPGFTLIAVLSLALGIGANTAIFSIIDALMLKQLPVRDPASLMLIGQGRAMGIFGGAPGGSMVLVSELGLAGLRQNHQFFEDACGVFSLPLSYHALVGGAAASELIQSRLVTGNYFSLLGVPAAAGRLFTDTEDAPLNAHADVVISYSYWKRRFAGDSKAVGQTMRIGSRLYTIVGVAAPDFFGTTVGESTDAWFPVSMMTQLPPYFDFHNDGMAHSLNVIARLNPGVTPAQAAAGASVEIRQLLRSFAGPAPSPRELREIQKSFVELTPAGAGLSQLRNRFSLPLRVLMFVVALVLLIACGNVANLLLARATAREREMAVRMAVGAGRWRTIRQLLTESLMLSLAGGALGILFAMWGGALLVAMVAPGPDPVSLNIAPNLRVLGFTLAVAMLTGLLFGLAPAFRASRVEVNSGLREGRGGTAARSRMWAGRALVIAQVALSLLLLIGAGLFVRSFRNLESIDTGFDRDHLTVVSLDTDSAGYKQDDRLTALYDKVESRVSRIPGVESVAFTMFAFDQGQMSLLVSIEGRPDILANGKSMEVNVTGPDFPTTMGIPMMTGRYFTRRDTAKSPKVAVIGEKTAREIFGKESPLGKHMSVGRPEHGHDVEIIGVVRDSKHEELREDTPWAVYVPYTQRNEYLGNLMIRTAAGAPQITAAVRRAIQEIDGNLPIREVATFSTLVDRSLHMEHLIAQLSGFFGALASLLAALGLYGILSYSVVRRTPEIGVRMALGAQSRGVLWMILRETLVLLGIGVAVGVPAALLCSRFIESMLYGLKPNDAVTIAAAVAVLAVIGSLAGWLPARKASQVDPMIALRYE